MNTQKFVSVLHLLIATAVTCYGEQPSITRQPEKLSVVLHQKIVLFVGASGEERSYQWRKDGALVDCFRSFLM